MSFTVRKEIRGLKLKEAPFPFSYFKGKRLKDLRGTVYSVDWKDALGFDLGATRKCNYKRSYHIGLGIQQQINKKSSKAFSATLGIKVDPVTKNDFYRTFKAGLGFTSDYTTVNAYFRKFSTALGLQEAPNKKIIKPFKEALGIGVLKINNAQQVLSDLRFYDKVLTETNFDETFTPFGYSKWKKMITGDYIYQKALCKYVMQASFNADRPNARAYTHKVDVPDVVDTGTVVLTTANQPHEMHFNSDRKFHIVPELNVTIKSYSGTGATPLVLAYDVTTKGFMVVMKNENGGYVEGTITYAARGY